MKFKSEHENPLPDLVELKAQIAANEADEGAHRVLVELRVHPHEIEESFGAIAVEISEAVLSVQFHGLEVVPGTKLGNPVVPTKTQQQIVRENSSTVSSDKRETRLGRGSVGASATGIDARADFNRGSSEQSGQTTGERTTRTDVVEHHNVKAIGNDNWKISASSGASLDGVYINHDVLCEVTPVAGTNRIAVDTEFVVRQRHLKADMAGNQHWLESLLSTNQKKIAKVLIAKSLHNAASDEPFDGTFIFAKSRSFDEG